MKYKVLCLLLIPFLSFSQTGISIKEASSTEDSGEYFGGAVKSVYKQHKFPSFNNSVNLVYNKGRWKVNTSISYGREKYFRENDVSTFFPDLSFIGTGTTDYDFNSFVTFIDVQYKISEKTKINVSSMNDTYENILDTKTNIDIYNTSDNELNKYYIGSKRLVSNLKRNSLNVLLRHDFDKNEYLTVEADWLQRPWDYNQNTYGQDYNVNGTAIPDRNYTVYHDGRTDLNIYTLNGLYHGSTNLFDFTVGGKWIYIESDYNIRHFRKFDADYVQILELSPICTYIENRQLVFSDVRKNFGKLDLQIGLKLENTFINGYVSDLTYKGLDDRYLKLFPSVNAAYNIDKENKITFAYSEFFNRPLYRFINPSLGIYHAYENYLGNPFLKPSTTNNINLGYSFKSKYDLGFSYSNTKDNFWSLTNFTQDYVVAHKVVSYMDLNALQLTGNALLKYNNSIETNLQLQGFYKYNTSLVPVIDDLDVWGWYGMINNQFYFNTSRNISGNLSFWYRSKNISQEALISKQCALDFGMKFLLLKKDFIIELNVTDILKSMTENKVSTVDNIYQTFRNYQDPRAFRISATYKFGNKKLNYVERIAENAIDHSR